MCSYADAAATGSSPDSLPETVLLGVFKHKDNKQSLLAGLGIRSSVFWSNRSFFDRERAFERFPLFAIFKRATRAILFDKEQEE